jgi:rhamnulokinase
VIQPGTILGGLRRELARKTGLTSVSVIAPACHDTGSAVAAIARASESVFISSGTWSLLGTETSRPIINTEAQKLNFTNEGGVCGTFRLLKNIMGLWLMQRCRQDWQAEGKSHDYSELVETARSSQPFRSLVDPDDPLFLHPENMPAAIRQFCASTHQPIPESPAAIIRTILESLALKYRFVLDRLEHLTGKTYGDIHIVGGGAKNALLNQFTAEATGRRVVAGPVEATALGNIGMQMVATKAAGSLEEVRDIIASSFPPEISEPSDHNGWEKTYARFKDYCRATMIQS